MEKDDDYITIMDGSLFVGTREQFMNCFFSNANDSEIISWCEQWDYKPLVINSIIILK